MAWQTPNLGWIDGGKGPTSNDLNRIEGNTDYLNTTLNTEAATRAANDTTEVNGRIAADAAEVIARNAAIHVEELARMAGDNDLRSKLETYTSGERAERIAADGVLATADATLQTNINNIIGGTTAVSIKISSGTALPVADAAHNSQLFHLDVSTIDKGLYFCAFSSATLTYVWVKII